MKAIFQGECHISSSDRESLFDQIDEDVDALFVENREDAVSPDDWSFGYLSFLVSALTFYWLQAFLGSAPQIEDEVDVPVFDEIDTPLPELYSRLPLSWTASAGLFAGLVFLYGIFTPEMTIPFVSTPSILTSLYTIIGKLLLVVGSLILFSGILIFLEERYMGSRDSDMTRSVTKIATENGYQTVVVSCGDMHLARLPMLFEEEDWDVEVNESSFGRIGKLWRFMIK